MEEKCINRVCGNCFPQPLSHPKGDSLFKSGMKMVYSVKLLENVV